MTKLNTPILFLVFNRLETTKKVFEVIRQAKPLRLYIAADGFRKSRCGEEEKVQAVQEYVVNSIDWDCELKTLFRENNLGCRIAVSTAIDWFFENEQQGIILEDDCIPELSFFQFCQELLEKYKDDERIMSIAAPNIQGTKLKTKYSYFFSRYSLIWGWATWKRAWKYYDSDMSNWPVLKESNWLLMIGNGNLDFQFYWTHIFDKTYAGENNSWAYRWIFSSWYQNGLTILPSSNLVRNIGYGQDATHTTKKRKILGDLKEIPIDFPLIHPPYIYRDYRADEFIDFNWFRIRILFSLKIKIIQIIRNIKKALKTKDLV